MTGFDKLNFLTGSETRWRALKVLFEEPHTFAELRSELDVPQSTLNRNLGKLTDDGWVREEETREYRLTHMGEFFYEQLRPIEDALTVVGFLSEYPDAFPLADFDFDVLKLAEADWRVATEHEPFAPINRVRAIYQSALTIHGFMPHYNPAYVDPTEEVVKREGSEVIGMVPDHQVDATVSDEDFNVGAFARYDNIEFRIWDGHPDYALGIVDDEQVIITGHHDGGMPSVMVESKDEEILAWAKDAFQERYEKSRSVVDAVE